MGEGVCVCVCVGGGGGGGAAVEKSFAQYVLNTNG